MTRRGKYQLDRYIVDIFIYTISTQVRGGCQVRLRGSDGDGRLAQPRDQADDGGHDQVRTQGGEEGR